MENLGCVFCKSRMDFERLRDSPELLRFFCFTHKALAEVTESREAYALRRLWRVAALYCTEGELPTPAQLYRRAGIASQREKPVIAAALEDALALLLRGDCQTMAGKAGKGD